MDDTTGSIIERITVRFSKPEKIPSGHTASIYYDVAQLTPNDLARLAAAAAGHLNPHEFDLAVGLAYAGIYFAGAIAGGREVGILQKDGALWGPSVKGKKIILVTDVVLEGRELSAAAKSPALAGAKIVACACIVDRSNGRFGSAELPLYAALRTNFS